ncbi:MAG: 3-oxoacyl-ACP reductase FabG [Polyangiaceae bacterium]|nr:3-oxoacyl-ACP reductase FabG [Polyangiaceae bacterium]
MIFFVTGGSRGIGEAIVLEAARQGHDVAFTYLQNGDRARGLVDRVKTIAPQSRCQAYELDVRDSRAVEEVGDRMLDDFGGVQVVVCNAGVNLNGLAAQMPDEDWKLVIDTNLTGTFYVCRQFLPTLVASRFGRIIMLSSLGKDGVTGQANYCASKAGLLGLSSALAKEYGRKGITSNVVVPGFFDTDMTRDGMSESNREFWIKYCPLGRMGELPEVAKVVLFLASDGASYINGQAISVTGGLDWAP